MPSPREPTPRRGVRPVAGVPAPEGARRRFTDRRGRVWDVHEERIPADEWSTADVESRQHGYGVGWLLFESAGVRRRLRLYAVNWHMGSDQELKKLCDRAHPVGEPPTSG